jgi:hypothetical protein
MTGIILLRNKYAYRYLDQFGKLRTMNLGVQSYDLAVKIASKFLGEPLNPERRPVTLEIGQYLQARASQLSNNWQRDNSCILLNWANEMREIEAALEELVEINAAMFQAQNEQYLGKLFPEPERSSGNGNGAAEETSDEFDSD